MAENVTDHDISSNTSFQEDPGTLFYVYYYGIFIIIGCINIPGNILVISTVFRHPVLRLPCNYYIVSLAVSDLLIGVVYPVYNISHLESVPAVSLPLGEWKVCRFIVTEVLALEICSSYHLVAITATRYIAIMKPLRYHRYVTTKSTVIVISLIWVLSQGVTIAMYNIVEPTAGYQFCRYELLFSLTHVAVLFVIQLFIPLFIMIGLYFRIAKVARAQARIIALQERGIWSTNGSTGNTTGSRTAIRNELKSTIMVSILLGFFAMSWTPMIIYFFIFISCNGCNVNRFVRATCRILLFLNSAVNVFIYAGRLKMFRQSIIQDLRSCFKTLTCKSDLELELIQPRKEQRFSNTNLSYLSDTEVNSDSRFPRSN
ncbi:hypothetical protein FSP39_007095 [Pinctada imbricata]|uniref:G-protein coupled receptors family 1 profile domain-containing protein n=1 Tax=Pinctada imbricata TaxID=66713 RepID=A0AA89C2S2_PINIB|nr:hypothetical protein FSP39_007095 [Pinctada imbricata]